MPLDTSIPLAVKPANVDIMGAYQNALAMQDAQMQRQALMQKQQMAQAEYQNALAARRYAGSADLNDPANAMKLLGYGEPGAAMFKDLQAGMASSASARKARLEASGVKAGQYRQMLGFVNNPSDAAHWLQMHHDDPDMQDSPVARMPLDVALSRIPQDPAGFQKWKQQAALGIDEYIKRNTMTANETSLQTDRGLTRGETHRHNVAMERLQGAQESRLAGESAGGVAVPKLKPGERWNPTAETVEAVPGSAEYIKQSKLHGKDYSAFNSVREARRLADEKIDYLLDEKNSDAFNSLFGGYNAKWITSRYSGKTAAAKTKLDELKSSIKNAGLRLIQQGGKIGAITEREWPILEGMIANLDSTLEEDDARAKLTEIKNFLSRTETNAADEYETTWSGTQYYKPKSPAVGTVEDGHRFKGGDPQNPANWEPL